MNGKGGETMPILKDIDGVRCKSRFEVAKHNKRILAERKGAAPKIASKPVAKPVAEPGKPRAKPVEPQAKPVKADFHFGTGKAETVKSYYCVGCGGNLTKGVEVCPLCGKTLDWSRVLGGAESVLEGSGNA